MTLNPFIVVLALIFWIWLWGPLGGFIAIPALLVVYAIVRNIIPGPIGWSPRETADFQRRRAHQTSGRNVSRSPSQRATF